MCKKGLVIVISGPSGAGKGTLLNVLRQNNENVRFSISATTRSPRKDEVEGQSYFYKTVDEFKKMIKEDELLEWVEYCDNYYGTPKDYVFESAEKGYDVIIEIEVEGAMKVMEKFPECVSIFILPPSLKELKNRIEKRGSETEESLKKRMAKAKEELEFANKYQYLLVNDDVVKASTLIEKIITTEKLKYERNLDVIRSLIKEGSI